MKKFKQLKEAEQSKGLVFTFGRFNPPTTGHEKLLKAVSTIANAQGDDFLVFPSQSQDPKKNPLSFTDKVKFMRKMFRNYSKNIVADKNLKTAFQIITKIYDMGYRDVTMVVGADRIAEFDKLLNKYNGVKGSHGFYDFPNGVQFKSAGEREDPDSDAAKSMSADAMSASLLRKLAVDGDFETFKKGVPDTLGDTDKRVLFNKIRTGMKLAAINEMFELLFDDTLLNEEQELVVEKAPPDEKITKWTEDPKVKKSFKDQYGDKWQEVMYATAWKMYKDQENEEWNVDEELDEDWMPKSFDELFEEEFKDYTAKSFNILREKFALKEEEITQAMLKQIEKYADSLFSKVGIDINFTRHFLDRVNDERNKKQITQAELIRLFKQSYAKYGKKIAQLGPDAEAVINDMMTDINMPFVLKWDRNNQELDLVAKTVMRKKNFMTQNQKLVVSGDNPTRKMMDKEKHKVPRTPKGDYDRKVDSYLKKKYKKEELDEGVTDVVKATKLVHNYLKTGKEEDAFEVIKFGWNWISNPQMRTLIVGAVKAMAEKEGMDWKQASNYIQRKTGIDVNDALKEELSEAAYKGNIGVMELIKFHDKASPKDIAELKKLIANDQTREAWQLVQKVTGVKLVGKAFETLDAPEDEAEKDLKVRQMANFMELFKIKEAKFAVDIGDLPTMYIDAGSEMEVKMELRRLLKKPDMVKRIERVQAGEVRKALNKVVQGKTDIGLKEGTDKRFKHLLNELGGQMGVTSNDLPNSGAEDDPYQGIQVKFVPYAVKIKGFPEFFLWSTSPSHIRSHVRLTLKYMDDLEYIERVTDAEVRKTYRDRAYNPSTLRAKDGDYSYRQDAYYRESLEWGTNELVDAYKKMTPGEELEITEVPNWIHGILAKTTHKNKYEKYAQALLRFKEKEEKDRGKHPLEWWAARLLQLTGDVLDARQLAKTAKQIVAQEAIFYAKENNMSLHQLFRPHSEMYYEVFDVAREMGIVVEGVDKYLLEQTNIGEFERFNGEFVPLDIPLVEEVEPELNSPKRGGSKKFYVYVKNDKGNVVKVEFGDDTGLQAKINDPEARKSFVARHDCDSKTDKTTPGYWSCRLPMYAKELGLEGGGDYFW